MDLQSTTLLFWFSSTAFILIISSSSSGSGRHLVFSGQSSNKANSKQQIGTERITGEHGGTLSSYRCIYFPQEFVGIKKKKELKDGEYCTCCFMPAGCVNISNMHPNNIATKTSDYMKQHVMFSSLWNRPFS